MTCIPRSVGGVLHHPALFVFVPFAVYRWLVTIAVFKPRGFGIVLSGEELVLLAPLSKPRTVKRDEIKSVEFNPQVKFASVKLVLESGEVEMPRALILQGEALRRRIECWVTKLC